MEVFPLVEAVGKEMPGQTTYTIPLKAILLKVSKDYANMPELDQDDYVGDIIECSKTIADTRSEVIITDKKDLETLAKMSTLIKKFGKKVIKKVVNDHYGKHNVKAHTLTIKTDVAA